MEQLGSLVPFLLIALVFWLLLIRPQRRRALELERVQRGLAVGDDVMLGSGIVGTIAELPAEGDLIGVELSPGVRVRVARGAVARVLEPHATDVSPDAPSGPQSGLQSRPTDPPTDLTKH